MDKRVKFSWLNECQQAFDKLKVAFTTALILAYFDCDNMILIETISSDIILAGVLWQYDDEVILCPVAFYSKKHSLAEQKYEIYDKESIAIVWVPNKWRAEPSSAEQPDSVLPDYRNFEYSMSNKSLSRHQTWWAEFLLRFKFELTNRPGKAEGKSDIHTRWSQDKPDPNYKAYQNCMTIFTTQKSLVEHVEKAHTKMCLFCDILHET